MRRANGTGSVYKIKDRKLRKPYKAISVVGYDLEGRPKRKVIGYFAKLSEANEALEKYSETNCSFELKKLTVKEIHDRWWEVHKEKLKPNSIKMYKTAYNKYISTIADRIFSEIKTLELQDFFDKIETNQRQILVKNTFMGMYQYALKYEIVEKNYAELIELKKAEKVIKRSIFAKEEIDMLFSLDDRIAKATCILLYTGLRIAEFLSLTRDDVIDGFIYVREAKTNAGVRVIPVHNRISAFIKEFLSENKTYLFTWDEKGKKVLYATFLYQFNKLMLQLGTPHTPHDTRHTFASMMNKVGANDVALTAIIGHEDISITKSVYTHKELEDLTEAINLLQ